ncbi:hypothetical protein PR001_g24601 [Phytophthora rubi]|nr:hypothetical protein PR001_g24601 [Phytophthora rubi]
MNEAPSESLSSPATEKTAEMLAITSALHQLTTMVASLQSSAVETRNETMNEMRNETRNEMRNEMMNDERDDEAAPTGPVDAQGDDESVAAPTRGATADGQPFPARTTPTDTAPTDPEVTLNAGATMTGGANGGDLQMITTVLRGLAGQLVGLREAVSSAVTVERAPTMHQVAAAAATRSSTTTMPPAQATTTGDDDGYERRGRNQHEAGGGGRQTTHHGRRRGSGRTERRRTTGAGPEPSDDSSSSSDDSSGDERRPRSWRRRTDSRSESESSSSESPSSDDDGDGDGGGRRRHRRHGRRGRLRERERRRSQDGQRPERLSRRKSVKDLELPTFTPSPKVSVSTWIDRVDLALQGAVESGRGRWSDKSLYFILGNKLMENAAKWWVDMDRRLPETTRTWTNLKKALLRRYGEKLDKSAAEWRVSMRRMMPGKTHADFAAGLRDVVGRNKVSERVLLAQFYRCLDKTTMTLVKQSPKPRTLEEAVDKATEIDDRMDNVAQGMTNIGQAWTTAPSRYVIPMSGTMGETNVIPGISGPLPTEMMGGAGGEAMLRSEVEHVALFTNPQGVYNAYSGTWDPPAGHAWNGKYWYEARKTKTAGSQAEAKKPAAKNKTRKEAVASSSDESDARPRRKKVKAAVKQATGRERSESRSGSERRRGDDGGQANNTPCYMCEQVGHWAAHCPTGPKCFACNQNGHFARECPNAEAKARNDSYLQQREAKSRTTAENRVQTP